MGDKVIDALKGFFSKKFRNKLKNDTIDEMIERMQRKEAKLRLKLDACADDEEVEWLKKQIKVLVAQIKKARALKQGAELTD